MKETHAAFAGKITLALLGMILFGCASPSSNPAKLIKAPVLWGQAAKGTARSLITNPATTTSPVPLGSDTLVPFSLSPVVTAWASSPVSANGTLSYSIFGQPVDVRTTQNTDGSTTFTSTISGNNGSGLADDHNTCVFTITLKSDNTFTFEQAIWIRVSAQVAPDSNPGDYANRYLHATGSGTVTNTSGDFTATGLEYRIDYLVDSSFTPAVTPQVHSITFHSKSVGGNIAILTDTDYFANVTTTPTPTWPVGQTGAATGPTGLETLYPAPVVADPSNLPAGVSSDQICGWYFVSDNGIRRYVEALATHGIGGQYDVALGAWGSITDAPGVGIPNGTAQAVYGQSF